MNDVAYDVTNFLEDHPGGPAIVLEAAGRELHGRVALRRGRPTDEEQRLMAAFLVERGRGFGLWIAIVAACLGCDIVLW